VFSVATLPAEVDLATPISIPMGLSLSASLGLWGVTMGLNVQLAADNIEIGLKGPALSLMSGKLVLAKAADDLDNGPEFHFSMVPGEMNFEGSFDAYMKLGPVAEGAISASFSLTQVHIAVSGLSVFGGVLTADIEVKLLGMSLIPLAIDVSLDVSPIGLALKTLTEAAKKPITALLNAIHVPFEKIGDALAAAQQKIDNARNSLDTAVDQCEAATASVNSKKADCDKLEAQAQAAQATVLLERQKAKADRLNPLNNENELVLTMEDANEAQQVEAQGAVSWGGDRRRRWSISKAVNNAAKATKDAAKAVATAAKSALQTVCRAALTALEKTMSTACLVGISAANGVLSAAETVLGPIQTAFDSAAEKIETATDKAAEIVNVLDMQLVSMSFGASLESGEVSLSISLKLNGVLKTYAFTVNVYTVLQNIGQAIAELMKKLFSPLVEVMMAPITAIKNLIDKLVLVVDEENIQAAYAIINEANAAYAAESAAAEAAFVEVTKRLESQH